MNQELKFLDPAVLRSISSIELKARLLVEGLYASRHRCRYYGYSVEFKDHREYVAGDEPRIIDWKTLARTERYYVRRFEMESNMNVVCLLDASGSMSYRPQDPRRFTKMEYASYLVASLSYLVSKQQDSPGLVTFTTEIKDFLAPKQGNRHLYTLLARLQALRPQGRTNLEDVLKKVALRLRRRGIFILVSDCHGDVNAMLDGLRHFAARGHDVVVLHLLDHDEIEFPFHSLTSFRDLETGAEVMCDPLRQRREYSARVAAFRDTVREGACACGADYWFVDTAQPIERVLRDYLLYRRQRG
ncbi:MAG TPA: DUF58 domain-containing protein [Planctomycetota bacterium]|jgi:uncharacterized protein (DUF58 family)